MTESPGRLQRCLSPPSPAQISSSNVGFHLRSQTPAGRESPLEVRDAGRPWGAGFGVSSTSLKLVINPSCLGFRVTSSLSSALLFARLARVMQRCLAKAVHPQGAASTQLGSLGKLGEVLSYPKELLSLSTCSGRHMSQWCSEGRTACLVPVCSPQ